VQEELRREREKGGQNGGWTDNGGGAAMEMGAGAGNTVGVGLRPTMPRMGSSNMSMASVGEKDFARMHRDSEGGGYAMANFTMGGGGDTLRRQQSPLSPPAGGGGHSRNLSQLGPGPEPNSQGSTLVSQSHAGRSDPYGKPFNHARHGTQSSTSEWGETERQAAAQTVAMPVLGRWDSTESASFSNTDHNHHNTSDIGYNHPDGHARRPSDTPLLHTPADEPWTRSPPQGAPSGLPRGPRDGSGGRRR
jgi:hypothetical protein